ncbi:MAG TPA: hypothetical protein VHP11_11905 [Tepidisphaeraceae bacterium]|nr:hypothetical protein [Tepidisphaeraceae bacterium]
MSSTPLPSRWLPRAQRPIPPLIWELPASADAIPASLLPLLASAATTWFLLPRSVPQSALADLSRCLAPLGQAVRLVIAINADQLQPRRSSIVQDRLAPFSRSTCEAVLLQDASPSDVKAGSPFHRLTQLRDRGLTSLFFIDAPDHASAEWMLDHSPAHAVALSFGLADQTAKYRLFDDAIGFGTGLLARPPYQLIWHPDSPIDLPLNIAFTLGESAITALLLPLPSTPQDLQCLLDAAAHPMPEPHRELWWDRFARQVPPPPRLSRSTPME